MRTGARRGGSRQSQRHEDLARSGEPRHASRRRALATRTPSSGR
uniref:Uncharacterized protein n=1 Tax=Arundo donax TaxID=35708 RepID=A0A0A9CBX3_ARUDO